MLFGAGPALRLGARGGPGDDPARGPQKNNGSVTLLSEEDKKMNKIKWL
jgi:hypothetical protein